MNTKLILISATAMMALASSAFAGHDRKTCPMGSQKAPSSCCSRACCGQKLHPRAALGFNGRGNPIRLKVPKAGCRTGCPMMKADAACPMQGRKATKD